MRIAGAGWSPDRNGPGSGPTGPIGPGVGPVPAGLVPAEVEQPCDSIAKLPRTGRVRRTARALLGGDEIMSTRTDKRTPTTMRGAQVLAAFLLAACGGAGGERSGDDGHLDAGVPADAYDGPTNTRTYQEGVDGYAGTRSVGISTYGGLGDIGSYNANGTTFADGQNDWCTGIDIPDGAYSEVWLLRFEDLGIAPGSKVVAASLSIHGYGDGSSGLFFSGRYLAVPWFGDTPVSCAGCSDSPVGWRWRDGMNRAWGALGAGSDGTDTVAGKSFRLPADGNVATGTEPLEYTTSLDPAVVQGWVDGASHGVRIAAGVPNVHMGFVQSQRDTAGRSISMRPKLTITIASTPSD